MENVKQILFVNACMRGPECSRTWKLCQTFLEGCRARWPESEIRERDLTASPLPVLTTELDDRRHQRFPENPRDPMFDPAHEVAQADLVVIGAPYWDLTFPAALKVYLGWASMLGITFRYTQEGEQVGMSRAGELVFITTAGGPLEGQASTISRDWPPCSASPPPGACPLRSWTSRATIQRPFYRRPRSGPQHWPQNSKRKNTAASDAGGCQLVKKALLQGVPSSADDGIKFNLVIFEDMRLGNDTSREIFADNFARNRGENFVQPNSKKWLCHFFDSLSRQRCWRLFQFPIIK